MLNAVLSRQGFVILDGGLATELERRGHDLNDQLWSAKVLVENPNAIAEVHNAYLASGADVITTSSYQASFKGLALKGYDRAAAERIFKSSVDIARACRDAYWEQLPDNLKMSRAKPLVAASVGSYGACLANGAEYTGKYDIGLAGLIDFHRDRVAVLASTGADILAFETIPSLEEARAIVEVLKEFPTVKAWVSFSCKDGTHCCHGEPFVDCIKVTNATNQIEAVGINCTHPAYISDLIRIAAKSTRKLIIAYPNHGGEWDAANKKWLPQKDPVPFSDMALQWLREGGQIVGGCCRTTPEDIAALSQSLR